MIETTEPSPTEPAIELRGVTKRFGDNAAVDDVSFTVNKGEVVGFLGPNGSGKTTTMRLITSYYTPDSGEVLVGGLDNQAHDVETRRKIGYLPENNPLYGDLRVSEFLNFIANLRGLTQAERQANVEQAVEETGISEVYGIQVSQCSKGYRQRVGLAQAILHRPDILILDEPTEGLDPNQRVPIRELIASIGEQRTVMLSTHVLPEAEEMCDRVVIISRGRLVAQGTVAELQVASQQESVIDLEIEGDGVDEALKRLTGVKSVERKLVDGARQGFLLSVDDETDLRPEISKLVASNGWTLWEMHRTERHLDELFHTLTAGEEAE